MEPKLLEACRAAFESAGPALTLGAPLAGTECAPEPLVRVPLAMMNRHGLIAGATGTGKTKTLQLMAEQLSAAGRAGVPRRHEGRPLGSRRGGRPERQGRSSAPATPAGRGRRRAFPVEFLSLTGTRGAQLRATVSSFGPLLLAKVLELNDTQTERAVAGLQVLRRPGSRAARLRRPARRARSPDRRGRGRARRATAACRSRPSACCSARWSSWKQQGATAFFGEPEFDLDDLMQTERDGRGLVSVLELSDVQDKPALFSTFMMWMLARLYNELPEVGDLDKPKLVFFFDEAHLLFDGASKAFLDQVEQVVRLIRSKGVGVFFVTQTPKDVPADVLGAARPPRAARAARVHARTTRRRCAPPRGRSRTATSTTSHEVLTTLGIGEAMVTVLSREGRAVAAVRHPAHPAGVAHGAAQRRRAAAAHRRRRRRCGSTARRSTARARRRSSRRRKPRRVGHRGAAARGRSRARSRRCCARRWRVPWPTTVSGAIVRGILGALGSGRRRW